MNKKITLSKKNQRLVKETIVYWEDDVLCARKEIKFLKSLLDNGKTVKRRKYTKRTEDRGSVSTNGICLRQ